MDDSLLSVIETCWSTIEAYSDLETSVAIAETCRSLYRAVVDADSKKIKVSHFEVDNSPSQSSSDETIVKNWHTAPSRLPHYLSRSLSSLHFPSLLRLALDFPATKRRNATGHADVIDDAGSTSFPIFVTNLSFAYNLECLYLNAGRLMATERSGHLEAVYEILAQNLCRCSKLRDLEVNNSGFVRGYPDPLHSVALTRAVIPTIQNERLKRLKMIIAGCPSDPIYARKLSTNGVDPIFDLFESAISGQTLSVLELTLSMSKFTSHFNALVAAAMVSGTTKKPSRLTKLRLNYEFDIRHGLPPVDLLSAAPLLDHFSECLSLTNLFLNLPAECWKGEENADALRRLLQNKPLLSSVTISYSFFSDRCGKMIKAIADGLAHNIASKVLCKLSIFGLRAVDDTNLSQIQVSLQAAGLICDKFGSGRSRGGTTDVMIMNNRKLMKGESVTDIKDAFKDFEWMSHQHSVDLVTADSNEELGTIAPGSS